MYTTSYIGCRQSCSALGKIWCFRENPFQHTERGKYPLTGDEKVYFAIITG